MTLQGRDSPSLGPPLGNCRASNEMQRSGLHAQVAKWAEFKRQFPQSLSPSRWRSRGELPHFLPNLSQLLLFVAQRLIASCLIGRQLRDGLFSVKITFFARPIESGAFCAIMAASFRRTHSMWLRLFTGVREPSPRASLRKTLALAGDPRSIAFLLDFPNKGRLL